jgi:acyl carrier protein
MGASVPNQTAPSDPEVEQVVFELVERMAPDKGVAITAETTLIDGLGYDSAQIVELGLALERRLRCQLKQTQLGATTVADLVGIAQAACRTEQTWDPSPAIPQDALRAEQAVVEAAEVPSTAARSDDSMGDY